MTTRGSYAAGLVGAVLLSCAVVAVAAPDTVAAKSAAVKKPHTVAPSRRSRAKVPPAETAPVALSGPEVARLAEAAHAGDIDAQLTLGEAYLNGGLPQDDTRAVAWLTLASDQGSARAASILGSLSLGAGGRTPDYAEAKAYFQVAADRGGGVAQFALGSLYTEGVGVEQDDLAAYKWTLLSGRSGDKMLGDTFVARQLGDIAPRLTADQIDEARRQAEAFIATPPTPAVQAHAAWKAHLAGDLGAFKTLSDLADGGEPLAQFRLGELYSNGTGVTESQVKAVEWYAKAIAQGQPGAQSALGFSVLVMKDGKYQQQAIELITQAARQGLPSAQMHLGGAYFAGTGVAQDDVAAFAWDKRAAEQGESQAQYFLGMQYAIGAGCPVDLVEAYKWETLALVYDDGHNDTEIRQMISQITAMMKPYQIEKAKALAADWMPVVEMPVTN